MLTARGMDIEQKDLEHAGVNLLMAKPFSPREVLARADELLDRHRAEKPVGDKV